MSQSDGALESTPFALELAHELPADPHAAEVTRAKAAASVGEFARSSSLEALDAVLGAAERGQRAPAATVRDAAARSRLLDAEVNRFRELARRG